MSGENWPVNIAYTVRNETGTLCYQDTMYRVESYWGLQKVGNTYYVQRLWGKAKSETYTKTLGPGHPDNPYSISNYTKTYAKWVWPAGSSASHYKVGSKIYGYNPQYKVKTTFQKDAWIAQVQREQAYASSTTSNGANLSSPSMTPYAIATSSDDRLSDQLSNTRSEMDRITNGVRRQISSLESSDFSSSYALHGAIASLKGKAEEALKNAGYTDAYIRWYFDPSQSITGESVKRQSGNASSPSGSRQTGPSNSPARDAIAPTPATRKVTIKAPFGYSAPPDKAPDLRPQIIQTYTEYVTDTTVSGGKRSESRQDIFYFPYVPNTISYSGLGSEWVDIDRQGNYPLVEWAGWSLMQAEMEFTVAEDRVEQGGATVPDGIFNSVQARIDTLRRMSQRRAPVSVFNLDDMFRIQLKRAAETGKPMEFVITDMQVTSLRRSMNSQSREITAATIRLTLREIPIEKLTVVKFSMPKFSIPVPAIKKPTSSDQGSAPLFSSGVDGAGKNFDVNLISGLATPV